MDRTDNIIDFACYRSRHQVRRLGGMTWVVYTWRTDYAVLQPLARHDERSRRARPMNLPAGDSVIHLELTAGVYTEPDDLIGQRVAHNLLRLHGKRNLLLDALARISDASRTVLTQIESGCSVPSIRVLCKITQGPKMSMTTLPDDHVLAGVAVPPAQQSKRLVSADGTFTSHTLLLSDVTRQVEFYELRLCDLGQEDAGAHAPGTQESPVAAQGVVEVRVDEERFLLATGDSILFYADQSRSYHNPTDSEALTYLVITYPKHLD